MSVAGENPTIKQVSVAQPWREVIRIHQAAELLPRMSPEDLKELGEDIAKNELKNEIAVFVDKNGNESVLDGINRLDAVEMAGLAVVKNGALDPDVVRYQRIAGNLDPCAFVLSANLLRRHLTNKQKHKLAAKLLELKPNASDRQIAKLAHVSHPTVAKVRAGLEGRGKISTSHTRTDSKGREQPAKKSKSVSTDIVEIEAKPTDIVEIDVKSPVMDTAHCETEPEAKAEEEKPTPIDEFIAAVQRVFDLGNQEILWTLFTQTQKKKIGKRLKDLHAILVDLRDLAQPPTNGKPAQKSDPEALLKNWRKLTAHDLKERIEQIRKAAAKRHFDDGQWRTLDRMRSRLNGLKVGVVQ